MFSGLKPCYALHRLQAAASNCFWLLGSRQGAASLVLKEPVISSNWGKNYCCLWFRKQGGRTRILRPLCLAIPIYKVWVTIFYLLQRDICKLMERKCSGTPHLGSWDTLVICPTAFRCALPKQQWVTKGINTLSLKCWLLPAHCVSVGSAALVLGAFSSLCSRLQRSCLQICWQNCFFSQMRGFLCFSISINSEEVWLMSQGACRPQKTNMLLQAPEWDCACYHQALAWMLTFLWHCHYALCWL